MSSSKEEVGRSLVKGCGCRDREGGEVKKEENRKMRYQENQRERKPGV